MRLPRDASGRDIIAGLERAFGYRLVHRTASHVVLAAGPPTYHRVTVPDHRALRIGTLNAILRAVARAQGRTKQEVAEEIFG